MTSDGDDFRGRLFLTRLIFALNIIASDWAVSIKSHGPSEGNTACSHLSDFYFRRVGGLWVNTHTHSFSQKKARTLNKITFMCVALAQLTGGKLSWHFLRSLISTLSQLITCWRTLNRGRKSHFSARSHWGNLEYWLLFNLLICNIELHFLKSTLDWTTHARKDFCLEHHDHVSLILLQLLHKRWW